jgi:hypothetical protein
MNLKRRTEILEQHRHIGPDDVGDVLRNIDVVDENIAFRRLLQKSEQTNQG